MAPWQGSGRGSGDPLFNIVSVLYHALAGVRACDQFVAAAELNHDDELVAFFEFIRDQETARAARARALLAHRISAAHGERPHADPEVLRDFENAAE